MPASTPAGKNMRNGSRPISARAIRFLAVRRIIVGKMSVTGGICMFIQAGAEIRNSERHSAEQEQRRHEYDANWNHPLKAKSDEPQPAAGGADPEHHWQSAGAERRHVQRTADGTHGRRRAGGSDVNQTAWQQSIECAEQKL